MHEADVRSKEDSELLDIWTNQGDYRGDVVEWVKAEIGKRQLDISHVHVRTAEEAAKDREARDTRQLLRRGALGNAGLGVLALFVSRFTDDLVGLAIWLAIGLILIIFAIGLWTHQRWALFGGLVFYALATIFNCTVTVANASRVLKGEDASGPLAFSVVGIVLSATFAWWFNALRKSGMARSG